MVYLQRRQQAAIANYMFKKNAIEATVTRLGLRQAQADEPGGGTQPATKRLKKQCGRAGSS